MSTFAIPGLMTPQLEIKAEASGNWIPEDGSLRIKLPIFDRSLGWPSLQVRQWDESIIFSDTVGKYIVEMPDKTFWWVLPAGSIVTKDTHVTLNHTHNRRVILMIIFVSPAVKTQ